MVRKFILFLLLLSKLLPVLAEKPIHEIPLSLKQYLSKVSKGNLSYIAEQFNVTIAETQLKAARVFADPEISMAYTNNQDHSLMMGQGLDAGISYPFSLGNKRRANISLATSQRDLAQSALDAYFQNLRAEAALNYFGSLRQMKVLKIQKEIGSMLNKLAQADSLRLKTGAINATDALQTALEARTQQNLVTQAEADCHAALIQLSEFQGNILVDSLFVPDDEWEQMPRNFMLEELIQSAQLYRSDLKIAIRNKEISEKQIQLIHANRAFEFNLDAGYSHNTIVKNEIAPAPAFNAYTAGVTIPIKFSSFNKGEVLAAKQAFNQYEIALKEVQLQITAEVTQAWILFKAAEKQLLQFQTGLIADAVKIAEARVFAYQHGESGLIEVLNAQHKLGDLRMGYQDSLYQYTEKLILLEKAAGIWDLD